MFNVLGHQRISKFYEGIVLSWGRKNVERLLVIIAVFGFFSLTIWIAVGSLKSSEKLSRTLKTLGFWFVSILLCFVAYSLLICSMVEIVHFPQYALLALWGIVLIGDTAKAVSIVTFLGILDETVNYILHPRFTPYLDFNDMVLNFCGAIVGVAFYHAVTQKAFLRRDHWIFNVGYGLIFAVVALFTVGILTGIVELENPLADPARAIQNGHFILSFQHFEPFWRYTGSGIKYHIMAPVEGILLLGVLTSVVHAVCEIGTRD